MSGLASGQGVSMYRISLRSSVEYFLFSGKLSFPDDMARVESPKGRLQIVIVVFLFVYYCSIESDQEMKKVTVTLT